MNILSTLSQDKVMATQLSTTNHAQNTAKSSTGNRQQPTFYSALTELVLQQKRQRNSSK